MGILTNFLKLLKPEPNDFVDVVKHISENYDKLDKNAETTNQTLTNLNNNKLDKGTYTGDAGTLNTEISKKSSKTILGRMIVGKGMTADSAGKVSVISKNDGIIVNDNDIELNIVDNLTTNSSTRSLSAKQGKKLFDEKLDKGTYSGNAGNLKAEIDGKVSKSGDTITGALTISSSTYSEVVFNGSKQAAVGYSVDGKFAYLRSTGTGLRMYENNTATLQANNLNTKKKEVVAAINELNSRGFVKIGECLIVNQSVSIYGYNEFVVCEKLSPNEILDIKYFTKDIVNSLKSFEFASYSRELECKWVFSADGNTITLKNLGYNSDGGIYVYGR